MTGAGGTTTDYPLHAAVFYNDVMALAKHLRDENENVDRQDPHGNTPLHLAVMLGYRESISLLLAHNATVKVKNFLGWNSLMEAISFGDRQTITSLVRKLKQQSREAMNQRKDHLLKALNDMDDFYLELKWDFHSWLPLVSRILPSDICKIYKKGTTMRFDTTLVDFNERTWERGDISFIFDAATDNPNDQLIILDNNAEVYQRVRYQWKETKGNAKAAQENEQELDEEVDVLMSSDMVNVQMSTKTISFQRSTTGWFFRHDKTEKVGEYSADFYNVEGLCLETRKRREHLSAEDIKKNKAMLQNFQTGELTEEDLLNRNTRKSLPPPPKTLVTYEQYITSSSQPQLGRPMHLKHNSKMFRANVAMSTDFPFSLEQLLDILEAVAPFKHINKLRQFCQVKMPPGFPVRLEIPLFPTISAKVTFQKLMFTKDLSKKMFRIPKHYTEDPSRFPDL